MNIEKELETQKNNFDNEFNISLKKDIEDKILVLFEEQITSISQEIDDQIYEIAKPEIDEQIDLILNELSNDEIDINSLKRTIHTLKGSLNMAGLSMPGQISHRVESILELIQSYNLNIQEVLDLIKSEFNKIQYLVENYRSENLNKQFWLNEINLNSDSNELEDLLTNNDNSFFSNLYEESIEQYIDEIDKDILEIALPEIQEQQESIKNDLDNFKTNKEIDIVSLKRTIHTLKGSLRMAGLNKAGSVAHRVESALDICESYNIGFSEVNTLIETEFDKINLLIESSVLTKEQINWIDKNPLLIEVNDKESKKETVNNSELSDKKINQEIEKAQKNNSQQDKILKVKASLIDYLVNDASELRRTKAALSEIFLLNKKGSSELKSASNKMQQILKELVIAAETQMQSQKQQKSQFEEGFDPLEFDRFTRLQELTRFLSEIVQDISDTVEQQEEQTKNQLDIFNQQSIISNNLLNELIKIRLVNVGSITDRLYKIVRTTAKELNKTVSLDVDGESTEVDRVVLDKIFDPIAHILRNSIAHGIEDSNVRLASKKPANGKIKLSAKLEGNYIVLSLSDDGGGINTEKIRESAIKKGIISETANLNENELINLIFMPGFSTATSVSQVAGRGVGMDVVSTEVRALGGTIKVNTKVGVGTTFILSIPVSVSTTAAMMFYSSNNLIALPAMVIDNIISIKKDKMQIAYEYGHIVYGENKIPFYYSGHLLGGPLPASQKPEIKSHNSVVIIDYDNKKLAMHVDSISGTNDILIKGVNAHMSKIPGILGTTELGDGTQSIIINPIVLLNYWGSIGKSPLWMVNKPKLNKDKESIKNNIVELENIEKQIITVMVVDDSITVRKTSEKVLINNGFEVILAKHGENALELLQTRTPDIILSDIEMPVMDGFDFLKNLKTNQNYKHIPVIMITSRTAEKHQTYAYSIGANGFMGKPFNEKELIKNIKTLIKK